MLYKSALRVCWKLLVQPLNTVTGILLTVFGAERSTAEHYSGFERCWCLNITPLSERMKMLFFAFMLLLCLPAAPARKLRRDSQLIRGSVPHRRLTGHISYNFKSRRVRAFLQTFFDLKYKRAAFCFPLAQVCFQAELSFNMCLCKKTTPN